MNKDVKDLESLLTDAVTTVTDFIQKQNGDRQVTVRYRSLERKDGGITVVLDVIPLLN